LLAPPYGGRILPPTKEVMGGNRSLKC